MYVKSDVADGLYEAGCNYAASQRWNQLRVEIETNYPTDTHAWGSTYDARMLFTKKDATWNSTRKVKDNGNGLIHSMS